MACLSSCERDPIYRSIIATVPVRIDVFFKPLGIPMSYGLFSRTLGTLVLWGVALGLAYFKCTQEGLINAVSI